MTTFGEHKLALTLGLCTIALGCGGEDPPSAAADATSSGTTSTASSSSTTTGSTSNSTTSSTSSSTTGSTSSSTSISTSDSTTGSASSTTGGTTGGNNYFPMVDGAVSVYFHTSNGGWEETTTLTEISPGVFNKTDSANPISEESEAILDVDSAGRVVRTSKEIYINNVLDRSISYAPGFVRFDPAWLSLAVDESIVESYERTETMSDDTTDTRPRSHIYTSLGLENVTVLDTTYRDCLVIHRERNYDDVTGIAEDERKVFHFCPHVGKVQEYTVDTGNYEQLVSYTD